MQIELSVERDNSTQSELWYGLVTLRSGKDSFTAKTENRSQSRNGAWDEILRTLQRAIDTTEERLKIARERYDPKCGDCIGYRQGQYSRPCGVHSSN